MSTIIFATMPAVGHLNAPLKLAKSLSERGHEICYLSGLGYKDYIEEQGLRFITLGESIAAGAARFDQIALVERLMEFRFHGQPLDDQLAHIVEVLRREIANLVRTLKPDLFLIDPYIPDLALIVHQFAMPFVFLNPTLFNPLEAMALFNDAPYLANVPELVLCPAEFDFPMTVAKNKQRYYLGPEVDLQRKEEPFDWKRIDSSKPLIYCSLGTQAQFYSETKRLFQVIIDALAGMPKYQMIVATGRNVSHDDLQRVPPNVLLFNYVPQSQILEKASVLITHGGLNTIKDALLLGTPMIVFPGLYDQPQNSGRVVYHGLGLTSNMRSVTVDEVRALIERVAETDSYRERVRAFGEIFRKHDEAGISVKVVEALLGSLEKSHKKAPKAQMIS
jgi:UDP:flavonoid glycosyltransferase YjiC (YdhE family)